MGYNRKTCSYCHGNHAILDCKKLPKRALEAEEAIANWNTVGVAKLERAYRYYAAYDYKRDAQGNRDYLLGYNKIPYESAKQAYELREHCFRSPQEPTKPLVYSREMHAELSDTCTAEEYNEALAHRWNTLREYRRIVAKNKEVQEKVQARAKKSCSYCRTAGHTVRTCPVMKSDAKLHRDAHRISAYHYARALSRFGFWTGAMAIYDEDDKSMPLMLNVAEFKAPIMAFKDAEISNHAQSSYKKGWQEVAQERGITYDDLLDFSYFKVAMQTGSFVYTPVEALTGGYNRHSRRFSLPRNGIDAFCLDKDCLSDDVYKRNGCRVFPTSSTMEHIYRVLVDRYRAPKRGVKYSSLNTVYHATDITQTSYISAVELFCNKVKERSWIWGHLEAYVEENQETLNKLDAWDV